MPPVCQRARTHMRTYGWLRKYTAYASSTTVKSGIIGIATWFPRSSVPVATNANVAVEALRAMNADGCMTLQCGGGRKTADCVSPARTSGPYMYATVSLYSGRVSCSHTPDHTTHHTQNTVYYTLHGCVAITARATCCAHWMSQQNTHRTHSGCHSAHVCVALAHLHWAGPQRQGEEAFDRVAPRPRACDGEK